MPGLTKARLVQLVQQRKLCSGLAGGALEDCVGERFEDFVLKSFGLSRNLTAYMPDVWTHRSRHRVIPDAVFPVARVGSGSAVFPDSGFLEVKATVPGVLSSSSFSYHLSVMIDVLAESPAAAAGTPGQLVIVTTSGVTIGPQLLLDAGARKVAIWHGEVSELPSGQPGVDRLQVGVTNLLNQVVYEPGFPAVHTIPAKPPGGL